MPELIALIFLLLPTYLLRFSIAGIPTSVLEIIIYLVALYGLWRAYREGFKKVPLSKILPEILLIVALIISIVISPDKRTALGEFKGFFIDPLIVASLIFQFIKKEQLPRLFWALIFSGTFAAIFTIIKRILGNVEIDGRVVGVFGYSPNYTALFLAPITVLALGFGFQVLREKKLAQSAVLWLLAVLNLLAIYFSASRGGFLAIIGGMGIFFIAYFWSWIRGRISAKIIIAILIIAAFYTAWSVFRPDFSVSPTAGRVATSDNVRWQIWQESLKLGTEHRWLGVGLGNFQNAFGRATQNMANFPEFITPLALTPHNVFLMFWLSTGLLGLIAFLWILVTFYFQGLKKWAQKFSPTILAVMSTIVLYGFIDTPIWKNDLSIIFWSFWTFIWLI